MTWRCRRESRAPRPRPAAATRGSSARRRPHATRDRVVAAHGRARRGRRPPGNVADERPIDRVELDLDDAPPPVTEEIKAGMNEESVEPGVEPVRVAQPGKALPRPDKTLLDRVARELRVPKDQPGRRVQPRDRPADEHGEGVMIAMRRPVHELSLVHGGPPGSGAAIRSRSHGMAPNCRGRGSRRPCRSGSGCAGRHALERCGRRRIRGRGELGGLERAP